MMESKDQETLPVAHISIDTADNGFIIRRADNRVGMVAAETRVAHTAEEAVSTACAMFSAHMNKWLGEQPSGQRD